MSNPGTSLFLLQVINKESEHTMDIDNVFYNTMGLPEANLDNWRSRSDELIGDEPVTYQLKHTKYAYPIVRLASEDEDAIHRVLDRAIAYSS